jgi:hypothetical protein
MVQQQQRWGARGCWAALAVFLIALCQGDPARAEDKAAGSLGMIPADAAYYGAMLRTKEQIDLVARSRAWKELWNLPSVQMGWTALKQQYNEGQLQSLRSFFEEEDNRKLLDFLADAASHEIFVYGGPNTLQFNELMGIINTGVNFAPLERLIETKGEEPDPKAQPRAILRAMAANPELIVVPDFVLGFKVTDTKRAQGQVERLETVLTALSNVAEMLKGRVKSAKVGGDTFLTINLDGEMVPWDNIPLKEIEEKEGEFDGLVKKLRELKLTLSLGVKGDYFLFTVGASTDVIGQLDGKKKRLVDRPELKPVLAALDKPLTGIGYASAAMRAQQGASQRKMMDELIAVARQGLQAAGLPADKRKQIERDLAGFSKEMLKEMPDYGAEVSFGYLSDRGFENYAYDYTKQQGMDGSKPLALLEHVGGSPLLAALAREKASPGQYRDFVKWAKVLYRDGEEVLLTKLDKEQRAQYEKATKAFFPLLARLDEITSTTLLPSLADGEAGLILDARWKSKQWQKAMPAAPQAMPMAEIALVIGVSDAALLKKAAAAYREVLTQAAAKLRELAPEDKALNIKFPPPKEKESAHGTLYSYPLPEDAGLDPQVLPTAGLSERVLVLAPSHAMAERLLAATPLRAEGGPLGKKRPLGSAAYFNWPALVDAALPWVEMGVQRTAQLRAPGEDDQPAGKAASEDILKQVRTVARVLKCFRGFTSATFQQDGVWVTHAESVFQDLPGGR